VSDAHRVVLISTPGADAGHRLARTLVGERLAACGSVVPAVQSVYRWQGAVEEEQEALVVLKTAADRVQRLMERALELHPYDVPEILALPVVGGNPEYLNWVVAETRAEAPDPDDGLS
jgi:periplasmic divalent cation tolerance protein